MISFDQNGTLMKCFIVLVAILPTIFSSAVDETEYYFGPEGLTKYLLNRFPTGHFAIGDPFVNTPSPNSQVTLCRQIFGDHSVHCVDSKANTVDITFKGDRNSAGRVIARNKTLDITGKANGKGHVVFFTKSAANHEYVGVMFNVSGNERTQSPNQTYDVVKTISGGAGISFRGGHKMKMEEELTSFFSDNEIDKHDVLRVIAGSKVIKTIQVGKYNQTVAKFGRAKASIYKIRKSDDNSVARIKIDGKVIVKITSIGGSKPQSIVAVSKSRHTVIVRKAD